jgi:hypothetical protein
VLGTRAFLGLAGYPKIGGGGLHIAHVLWGGLLLMAGLAVTLLFHGRGAQLTGAVLGGAGFGLFIDEVGKFVTERTDYFYRPAAGIIYVVFAALVVLARWLRRRTASSPKQRTADAVQLALVGVTSGLSAAEHAAALRLVEGSDREVDVAVANLLRTVPVSDPPAAWTWLRAARAAVRHRLGLVHGYLLRPAIGAVVALPLFTILGAVAEGSQHGLSKDREFGAIMATLVVSLASVALSGYGAVVLRRSRIKAFRLFAASVLVDLFAGQIFKFTVNQFAAVTALVLDVLLLWVIRNEYRRLQDAAREPV